MPQSLSQVILLVTLLPSLLTPLCHGLASDTPWRPFEQPDLKPALEQAPLLQTESLGEPARGVNVWERWMVPNLDGKSWDVLQIYFKEYYGPTWLFAVDLRTGQVKKQRLADGHQFCLSGRALGFDGKYYSTSGPRPQASSPSFVPFFPSLLSRRLESKV